MNINFKSTVLPSGITNNNAVDQQSNQVKAQPFQQFLNPEPAAAPLAPKVGLVQGFKNGVANVRVFFMKIDEYVSQTAKGIAYGSITAGLAYGVLSCANGVKIIKNKFSKKTAENLLKPISARAKTITAAVIGAGTLLVALYDASLNVSKKKSEIYHTYTGHDTHN